MREVGTHVGYQLVFCVWLLAHGLAEGGCGDREAHKCCPGRNNDCSDFFPRRTPCYCDTYCEKTGDCCEDYHSVCQISAVDCVVGPWGPWSECNALCGTGSKDRTRQVTLPPRNGGTPCPDLKQRRGCLGENPACDSAKGAQGGAKENIRLLYNGLKFPLPVSSPVHERRIIITLKVQSLSLPALFSNFGGG